MILFGPARFRISSTFNSLLKLPNTFNFVLTLSLHCQLLDRISTVRWQEYRSVTCQFYAPEDNRIPLSAPPLSMVLMASNGGGPAGAFAPVLNAMSTMRDGQREQKKAAHSFLENFQKSVGLPNITFAPATFGSTRLTYSTVRSMADHHRTITVTSRSRSPTICSYDIEGKGRRFHVCLLI